jgi:hypothetical protein
MNPTFTFWSDPGHGWLEVNIADAEQVGLFPSDFSECSYRKGHRLFLEEDLDAGVFIKAWKAAGNAFTYVEENEPDEDSFVRNLPRIY